MTADPTAPDAAVQIARRVLKWHIPDSAEPVAVEVVTALVATGWLHDPTRVAELEAENERLRHRVDELDVAGEPCWQCGHLSMREHGPGGCVQCGCSSPFGGLC